MNLEALHKIGYGLYIIGSIKGDKLNGQTANSVFQVTSVPPTIAVSISKTNLTHEFIQASKVLTASVLSKETPLSFIGRFGFRSGRDMNKLEGVNYKAGITQAPVVLDNAVAYMEAKVVNQLDVGTHTVFIAEIVASEIIPEKNEEPMSYAYYHEVKRGTLPKAAPGYIEGEKGGR